MTIHKSKGLEFPFCYFLHNHSDININDIKAQFVFDNKYGIVVERSDDAIYKGSYNH